MKIAVVSDIHGNYEGFLKVLAEIKKQKVSKIYCLGDSIGYLPQSDEVIKLLIREKIVSVCGNHEKAFINGGHFASREAEKGLEWCRKHLSSKSKAYILRLPASLKIKVGGVKILLIHGGPGDFLNEYVYPQGNFEPFLQLPYDVIIFGNTHVPFFTKIGEKHIVNAGSAGFSRDKDSRLSVVFVEIKKSFKVFVEIKRIAYNPDRVLKKLRELDFPVKLASYLYFGTSGIKFENLLEGNSNLETIYRLIPKRIFSVLLTSYCLFVEMKKDSQFLVVIYFSSSGGMSFHVNGNSDRKVVKTLEAFIRQKRELAFKRPNFNLKGQLFFTIKNPLRVFKFYNFFSVYQNQIKETFEISHFDFVQKLTDISRREFDRFQDDLFSDNEFYFRLKLRANQFNEGAFDFGRYQYWNNLYYLLIRKLKPKIVLETGVERGISSAFALKALRDNKFGSLHSIDLPASSKKIARYSKVTKLPAGLGPGWIIPEGLIDNRWRLYKGKSEDLMPGILKKLGKVDIFLHDSLHTYSHMKWEYKTVWPKIASSGLLLSDNIDWKSAGSVFSDFSKEVKRAYVSKYGFGGLRK